MVGIASTIDNDLIGSEITIGVDTAPLSDVARTDKFLDVTLMDLAMVLAQ